MLVRAPPASYEDVRVADSLDSLYIHQQPVSPLLPTYYTADDNCSRWMKSLLLLLRRRSLEDGGLWSLTLGNYISTNKLVATHSSTIRGLYGRADRLVVIQSPRPLVPSRGLLIDDLCLYSLLPVSESKLSTLQLLCPAMTRQDRENLVALATAGLINWEENAGEKRHRTLPLKKMVHPGLRECFFFCVSQMCTGIWRC